MAEVLSKLQKPQPKRPNVSIIDALQNESSRVGEVHGGLGLGSGDVKQIAVQNTLDGANGLGNLASLNNLSPSAQEKSLGDVAGQKKDSSNNLYIHGIYSSPALNVDIDLNSVLPNYLQAMGERDKGGVSAPPLLQHLHGGYKDIGYDFTALNFTAGNTNNNNNNNNNNTGTSGNGFNVQMNNQQFNGNNGNNHNNNNHNNNHNNNTFDIGNLSVANNNLTAGGNPPGMGPPGDYYTPMLTTAVSADGLASRFPPGIETKQQQHSDDDVMAPRERRISMGTTDPLSIDPSSLEMSFNSGGGLEALTTTDNSDTLPDLDSSFLTTSNSIFRSASTPMNQSVTNNSGGYGVDDLWMLNSKQMLSQQHNKHTNAGEISQGSSPRILEHQGYGGEQSYLRQEQRRRMDEALDFRSPSPGLHSGLGTLGMGDHLEDENRPQVGYILPPHIMEGSTEATIVKDCVDILVEASNNSLKAVELANTLRARIGQHCLVQIREKWGGLLSLLEETPGIFTVSRIPKNDFVSLALPGYEGSASAELLLIQKNAAQKQQGGGRGGAMDGRGANSMKRGQMGGHPGANGGNSSQRENASRCLHVGNVPAQTSEAQLFREFEKYGDIEGLKIVAHRSRRFAFVTFVTIEQAISAKQRLVKLAPWKSAISYAHKESITPPAVPKGISGPYGQGQMQGQGEGQGQGQGQGMMVEEYNGAGQRILKQTSPNNGIKRMGSSNSLNASMHSVGSDVFFGENQGHHNQSMQTSYPSPPGKGVGVPGMADMSLMNDPILRRLCDSTFVPTRAWPADASRDAPYCTAVIQQLQQFNNCTSISKLRGALKSRLHSPDNIKSVPLKAMLSAYPVSFIVRGNQVSLTNDGNRMPQSNMLGGSGGFNMGGRR